jgi:hypothetical protein
MNGRFPAKLKFERMPETEGIIGMKQPPEGCPPAADIFAI